jgi:hypothetical protein
VGTGENTTLLVSFLLFYVFQVPSCTTEAEHGGKKTREGVKSGVGRLNKWCEGNESDPIPPVVHKSGPMFHGDHAKIVDD